jgi:hypothetical protein
MERTGLQRIIVYCGSRYLGAAADCLYREHLGEREKYFTSILFTFQKAYEEKFPKMTKNSLRSPKIY